MGGAGVGSGTSIPRVQSGRANPRGRVHADEIAGN